MKKEPRYAFDERDYLVEINLKELKRRRKELLEHPKRGIKLDDL